MLKELYDNCKQALGGEVLTDREKYKKELAKNEVLRNPYVRRKMKGFYFIEDTTTKKFINNKEGETFRTTNKKEADIIAEYTHLDFVEFSLKAAEEVLIEYNSVKLETKEAKQQIKKQVRGLTLATETYKEALQELKEKYGKQ